MEKIIVGKLLEPFMGYKIGAIIYGIENETRENLFNILFDIEDENFGFAFSTNKKPEIEVEKILISEKNIIKFWTYLNLINRENVKIPTKCNLFEDEN